MKVIIAGAGIMGLACGWRLAKAGAQVTILETRTAGGGATLASLGALWPSSPLLENPLQELHRKSLWQFESFLQEISAAAKMPIAFRRLGHLEILASQNTVARAQQESAAACSRWPSFFSDKPQMEVLSPAQIQQFEPAIAPSSIPARLCRNTAQVNVHNLVAALRAACLSAGAQLHEHAPVTRLQMQNDRIASVQTATQSFAPDAVLITAGAWSPLISPLIRQAAPLRPAKGQALALSPPPGLQLRCILKSGPIYLIPWQDQSRNEILIGSTTEPEAGFDETPTAAARESLFVGAVALVPALKSAKILRHWTGLRPENPAKSHPPIMGPHPLIKNLHFCTGHFKTGIGMSPIASQLVASAILQSAAPAELSPFLPRIGAAN